MPVIITDLKRTSYLTTALIGTGIAVVAGIYLGVSSPTKTHNIRDIVYTDAEYIQLKNSEISIIENRKNNTPTFEEAEIWKSILIHECGEITLTNVTSDIIVDSLNNYLKNGCK